MKNKITLLVLVLLSLAIYSFYTKKEVELPVSEPATSSTSIVYSNSEFGFTFSLPLNWKGYSIVKSTWEGTPLTATSTKQIGSKLSIRNPKWTSVLPYQDIPVMVFTTIQWNSYVSGNFSVSAAPIEANELGRNNLYVFALPPRWNFDSSEGYAEAESIVKSNPLKAFTIQTNVSQKLNINFICEGSLSYMTFPDGASADKFVAECKEGKHPEVIERYKTEMNILNGAVI